MRKSNEQTLKEIIGELLDSNGHAKQKIAEVNLVNHWPELVGPLIAKNTEKIYIAHEKLILHITSAPLRNELQLSRSKIVEVVNEHAGMELIKDVMLLGGIK
jgi:hypothetical protein